MNLNRLTEKAQEALLAAQQAAEQAGHPELEPEHLLAALAAQQDGVVPPVLRRLGVDPAAVADAARAVNTMCGAAQAGPWRALASWDSPAPVGRFITPSPTPATRPVPSTAGRQP